MRSLIVLASLVLAGCGGAPAPVDPGLLAKPLPRLMLTPEPQMAIPVAACEGDPSCRAAEYYAPHRNQCAGFRDGQIGLQAYVASLHGVPRTAWAAEVLP